jgi:hypothetical protein
MCYTYPTGPSNLCDLPIDIKRRLYAAQLAVDKALAMKPDLVEKSLSSTGEYDGIDQCQDGEKKEEVLPAATVPVNLLQSTEKDGDKDQSA